MTNSTTKGTSTMKTTAMYQSVLNWSNKAAVLAYVSGSKKDRAEVYPHLVDRDKLDATIQHMAKEFYYVESMAVAKGDILRVINAPAVSGFTKVELDQEDLEVVGGLNKARAMLELYSIFVNTRGLEYSNSIAKVLVYFGHGLTDDKLALIEWAVKCAGQLDSYPIQPMAEAFRRNIAEKPQFDKGGVNIRLGHGMKATAMKYSAVESVLGFVQASVKITSSNTTAEVVDALSRIHVFHDTGARGFNIKLMSLSWIEKLILLRAGNLSYEALIADPAKHLVLRAANGAVTPVSHPMVYSKYPVNQYLEHFKPGVYGLVSGSHAADGYIREHEQLGYMLTEQADGSLLSALSIKHTASRFEKLCNKDGVGFAFGEVWVLRDPNVALDAATAAYDAVKASKAGKAKAVAKRNLKTATELRNALVAGNILADSDTMLTVGFCRAVGDNTEGLIKSTLSWAGFVDKDLADAGVSLASKASYKGGLAGLYQAKHPNCEVMDIINDPTELNSIWEVVEINGLEVEVCVLNDVQMVATNHYTISHGYKFVDRDFVVNSYIDNAAKLLEAAYKKHDIIGDDPLLIAVVFNKVAELADAGSMAPLPDALRELRESGVITRKPKVVNVVSSEFDMMRTTHGQQMVQDMLQHAMSLELNSDKKDDVNMALDWVQGRLSDKTAAGVYTLPLASVVGKIARLVATYGLDLDTLGEGYVHRAFFVDVACVLGINDPNVRWVELTDKAGTPLTYLTGQRILCGNMAETSAYATMIQSQGYFNTFLKAVRGLVGQYEVDEYTLNLKAKPTIGAFVENFSVNMLQYTQCEILGKQLGRLKVEGMYGALICAPWASKANELWCLAMRNGGTMLATKHPVIMPELQTGMMVHSKLPKRHHALQQLNRANAKFEKAGQGRDSNAYLKAKRIAAEAEANFVEEDMLNKDMAEIFNCAVFAPANYLLSLQNDADGDLVRLTSHGKVKLNTFEAKVLDDKYFAAKWHQNYLAKEMNALGFGGASVNQFSWVELFATIKESADAKANVGSYTKNLQRFFTYHTSVRMDGKGLADIPAAMHEEFFNTVAYVIGVLVQEEAMNGMKHSSLGSKLAVSEIIRPGFILQKKDESRDEYIARLAAAKEAVVDVFTNGLLFNFSSLNMSVDQFCAKFMAVMRQVAALHLSAPSLDALMFSDQSPLTSNFVLLKDAEGAVIDGKVYDMYTESMMYRLIQALQA
jgi:hypothetical protein